MYLNLTNGNKKYFASVDVMFWWMNQHLDLVIGGEIYDLLAPVKSEWLKGQTK